MMTFLPPVRAPNTLTIALINNSSNRSIKATERHFCRLLRRAAAGNNLRIDFFTCWDVGDPSGGYDTSDLGYRGLDDLFKTRPDGIVVTGLEPQAAALPDEPLWPSLTRLVSWTENQGVPGIWSCLAAHAAVYRLDGIARQRLPEKLSGVFACEGNSADHPLLTAMPPRWNTPHSRYNTLSEEALLSCGYEILSKSDRAGVDMFIRTENTTHLFCQGHPEYHGETLMREYRRDLYRYFNGKQDEYPAVPRYYFNQSTVTALETLRLEAARGRCSTSILEAANELLQQAGYATPWEDVAARLYANWLNFIAIPRCKMVDLVGGNMIGRSEPAQSFVEAALSS